MILRSSGNRGAGLTKIAKVLPLVAMFVAGAACPPAAAEPAEGRLTIQLNKAETIAGSCRITLVARNGMAGDLAGLGLDLVVFDKASAVVGYAAIDIGVLPEGKTRVRQYDVATSECSAIDGILVNEVRHCGSPDAPSASCQSALSVSSRSEIGFFL